MNTRQTSFSSVIALCLLGTLIFPMDSTAQISLDIPPIRTVMDPEDTEGFINLDDFSQLPTVIQYQEAVIRKIQKVIFSWPKSELGARIYGSAMVTIAISEDGSLTEVYANVDNTPNPAQLVRVATKLVQAASPFPAPPRAILHGRKGVRMTRRVQFIDAQDYEAIYKHY